MEKIILIQIDNNLVPIEASNDIVVLDSKRINDFCSMLGYELVDGLSDNNGKPLFQSVRPSYLLSDYAKVDINGYNKIISQWQDILVEILHNGICNNEFVVKMPYVFAQWLVNNESSNYSIIGNVLLNNNCSITLSDNFIYEEIVKNIKIAILNAISSSKGEIECIVFSNPLLSSKSDIFKQLIKHESSLSIIRYDTWIATAVQSFPQDCTSKDDGTNEIKQYDLADLHFGKSDIKTCGCKKITKIYGYEMDNYKSYLYEFCSSSKYDCLFSFDDNYLLNGIIAKPGNALFKDILHIVTGENLLYEYMSYNDISKLLLDKNFILSDPPHIAKKPNYKIEGTFESTLYKENRCFVIKVKFSQQYFTATNNERQRREYGGPHSSISVAHPPLGEAMAQMDTLYSITILMKPNKTTNNLKNR